MHRIFYSWQTDSEPRYNRSFIEDCLKRAIAKLRRDDVHDVILDRDTKGIPGMPRIDESVLNKISAASLIVSDLSIINPNRKDERAVPNPNVLFETGFALAAIGDGSMIGVFNTEHGAIEDLPFDIRSRRVLSYSLHQNSDKQRVREDLTRRLFDAIKLSLQESSDVTTKRNTEIVRRLRMLWLLGSEIGEWAGVDDVAAEIHKCKDVAAELPMLMHAGRFPDYARNLSDQMHWSLNHALSMDLNEENWSEISTSVRDAGEKAKLIFDHLALQLDQQAHDAELGRLESLVARLDEVFYNKDDHHFATEFATVTVELREIAFLRLHPKHPLFSRTLLEISRELRGVSIRWRRPELRSENTHWAAEALTQLKTLCERYKPHDAKSPE